MVNVLYFILYAPNVIIAENANKVLSCETVETAKIRKEIRIDANQTKRHTSKHNNKIGKTRKENS